MVQFTSVGVKDSLRNRRVRRVPGNRAAALELGNPTVVIGRVVHATTTTDVFDGNVHRGGLPAIDKLRPLARLGRNEWCTIGAVLDITRIPHDEWPGRYSPPTA